MWKHLSIVLEVLRNKQLYAKFEKCYFWLEEVKFLGHVINWDDVTVDPSKTQAVLQLERSIIVIEIQSFLAEDLSCGFRSLLYPWLDWLKKEQCLCGVKSVSRVSKILRRSWPLCWSWLYQIWQDHLRCTMMHPKKGWVVYWCRKVRWWPMHPRHFLPHKENYPTHNMELAVVVYALTIWSNIYMVFSLNSSVIIRVWSTCSIRMSWIWDNVDE